VRAVRREERGLLAIGLRHARVRTELHVGVQQLDGPMAAKLQRVRVARRAVASEVPAVSAVSADGGRPLL
jgi:hypothetical protein